LTGKGFGHQLRTIIMDGSLRSPSGVIQLRTTVRGLPVALRLDQRELSKAPTELAHDILLLCQLAGKRQQVAQRRVLIARGFTPAAIQDLNLGTEEELLRAEAEVFGDDSDSAPETWMKSV
jgi:hypothetical protein